MNRAKRKLFIFALLMILLSSGFMLTELRQIVPVRLATVIIGVVWFLYHAPVILFSDYNNGNIPYSMFCFLIMVMGFTIIANDLCKSQELLASSIASCKP